MFTILNASFSFAGPAKTTYQAKIVKPDGHPLEASSVNFKFTILDPAGSCILYSETYSSVNMSSTGGLISFSLGSGVKTYPASATTFEQVFSNITPSLACDAGGPPTYSPLANDSRKIVMQFHDGTGWQTLPAMSINAVPYAMYANEASKLDGKTVSDFVQNASLATCGAGEALSYNGASFSCLTIPNPQTVSGAAVISALGYTPADGASVTTLSSSLASANATISSVSSTVASVSSTVFSVSSTVTSLSNTVSGISTTVSDLSASMAAMVSSQWVTSGTTIYYNNNYIGIGTSNPTANISFAGNLGTQNITVDRAASGGGSGIQLRAGGAAVNATDSNGGTLFLSSGLSTGLGHSQILMRTMSGTASGNSDNVYINRLVILGNGNIGMGTNTPATKLDVAGGVKLGTEASTCSASLAGTLRYNGGAVEYCNGTSWAAFGVSGAGLQALNGSTSGTQTFTTGSAGTSLNISSTNGVHTFNIPLASTGAVTGGLISNADYTTFMGKVSATTLGNYVLRANNLSDLTSSATARTNLGLGSFATANSIDLGSASATGTLAVARLPNFTGDATSVSGSNTLTLANSGVSAGTYTKVTVDVKGRVTSGALLTFSDVTTALGFTPSNSSSATQWTTSGTGIYYNSGNVAIGTTTPTEKLSVAGNINLVNPGATIDRYVKIAVNGGGERSYVRFDQTAAPGPSNYWDIGSLSTGNIYDFGIESSGTRRVTITFTGNMGIGVSAPTAKLHLASGTASLAPLKLTSGTLLSSPVSGAIEYDGSYYYITDGANTRRTIATVANPGTFDNASTITSTGNITMVPVGSVVVSSTTASTNSSTGALVVKGGLGVAGNIYTSGTIVTTSDIYGSVLNATSATVTPYIYGSTVSGGSIHIDSTSNAAKGSVYIAENGGRVGIGTTNPNGNFQVGNITASSSALVYSASTIDPGVLRMTTNSNANWIQSGVDYISDSKKDLKFSSILGSTTWMTIQGSTGNVGIGTGSSSPGSRLHVVGNQAIENNTNSSGGSSISFWKNRNYAATQNGDELGYISFFGHDGSTTTRSAYILSNTDGVPGAGSSPGNLRFFTTNAGNADSTEKMRITSAGAVGIGTTDPQGPLHVYSNSPNAIILERSSSLNSHIQYKNSVGYVYAGLSQSGNYAIGPNASLASSPYMTVQSGTGYVGLGVVAPIDALDVSGNVVVRSGNIFINNDAGTNTNNDYITYDDNTILGTGGVWSFNADTTRGNSYTAATAAIAARAGYFGNNLSIGTTAQTRTLEVNGSISAGGMASEVFSFTVDNTSSGTWAIGSLSNNGTVVHVNFEMYVHNASTIDALRFQVSLPTYSNGPFYPNWQELPVAFGSTAWTGAKNYVIDVLRSSSSAGQPIFFRVRNKGGNGSSSTMKIRMSYNSDMIFTRITHVNTTATAFNAATAAAGGPVDGMYGALEYSFPVATGQAWRPADNTGMFIKNSGYVGIGTSTPSVELEVSGTVKAQAYLYTSDRRLKKDIVTLPDALANVLKLRGVNFVWRNNNEKTMGFIAQEVEEVYPELVKTDKASGFKAVQYGNIVAVLVEAIKQENKERLEAQNKCEVQLAEVKRSVASVEEKSADRMNKLEKENQDLKSRLEKLEKLLLKK